MSELYPLKFEPVLKEKIWGGDTLAREYGKNGNNLKNIGESWELSAVSGDMSVIRNGFLAGNNIEEIIEVYMGDITGETIYEKFGNEFPLLIKLIEAREDLSIQVHPGNEMAKKRHKAYGKTEMWHILKGDKSARIYAGFSKPVTRELYLNSLNSNTIQNILNIEEAEPGDTFFIPAGTIHAIGAGIVLAEIQQTSDITYRISDWGRKNEKGESRELHTSLALDAIDFQSPAPHRIRKDVHENNIVNLVSCEFFNTNILHFNKHIERDFNLIDSFVIYICIGGNFSIHWDERSETVSKGETVLLPALIRNVILKPEPDASVLEVYINTEPNQS